MSELSIIVPTCCKPELAKSFFSSLYEHTPPCNLYLICNGDAGDCRLFMQFAYRNAPAGWRVHEYYYPERIGYVGACNVGWKLADPAYTDEVAILNDDVMFSGRWYEPLSSALGGGVFQAGPSVKWIGLDGFWGVGDGRERYTYCEGWCFLAMADGLGLASIGGIRDNNTHGGWYPLFDPCFAPSFCEDQDLSIRIQEYAGQIAEVDIPVRHLHSQTIANDSEKATYFARNRKLIQSKWHLANPQWGVDKV